MNFIKKNIFWIAILVIAALMLSTTLLTIYSSRSIERNSILLEKIDLIKGQTSQILTGTMHGLDLGVRGFAILKQEGLLNPYDRAITENDAIFKQLHQLLTELNYPTTGLDSVEHEVNLYIQLSKEMVQNIRIDSLGKVKSVLQEDHGYIVWKQFESFKSHLFQYLDKLEADAIARNKQSESNVLIIQVIMLLFSFPILGFIIYKLNSDKKERHKLVKELHVYNRNYVFNSGRETEDRDEEQIIQNSIEDMKEAVNFVKAITQGNYDIEWKGYTTENAPLNADNLSGHLHNMREKMLDVKADDQQKIWINEGLANFGQLLREYSNTDQLMEKVVSFIANYLKINQVWLFDRQVNEQHENFLVLEACYAFDRKKYIEKTVQIGEGLVGEAFREGNRIYLTEIPNNYVEITSGLGGSQPTCILIEPLIFNDQVEGILEMASFSKLQEHELLFVQKIAESLASTLSIHQTNQQTKLLLEQTQQQTALMREQEEEMRVNMEELMFMQEESERQLKITEELKNEAINRELVLSKTTILSESDLFGTITYCNDKLTEVSKYSREELIGKGHNIFRNPEMPKELFKIMWETIQAGNVFQGVVKNRAKDGTHYWVDATIVPIKDENGKIVKYIGARYHITNEELAQKMYAEGVKKLGLA